MPPRGTRQAVQDPARFNEVGPWLGFYVNQHNEIMPNAALGGRTPEEVFRGGAGDLVEQLREKHKAAIAERIAAIGDSNVRIAWSRYGRRQSVTNQRG